MMQAQDSASSTTTRNLLESRAHGLEFGQLRRFATALAEEQAIEAIIEDKPFVPLDRRILQLRRSQDAIARWMQQLHEEVNPEMTVNYF
jgi:hypothetical protein